MKNAIPALHYNQSGTGSNFRFQEKEYILSLVTRWSPHCRGNKCLLQYKCGMPDTTSFKKIILWEN